MAGRKKDEAQRQSVAILIRTTPDLKARLDAMADATGVPISQTAREVLLAAVESWETEAANARPKTSA